MPAIGEIYRYVVACHLNDQDGLNVRYFTVLSQTGPGMSQQEMTTALGDIHVNYYKALLCNVAEFTYVSTRLITTPVPFPIYQTYAGQNGTAGANTAPLQTAGIFTVRSLLAGRSGRGRVYVPFPSTASMTNPAADPKPVDQYMTDLGALALRMSGQLNLDNGAGSTMTVQWGLYRAGPTPVFTPVYTYVTRRKWATQRRRGNYGRPNP